MDLVTNSFLSPTRIAWAVGLLIISGVVWNHIRRTPSPTPTENITVTYDGGTHPIFNLTMKQGYNDNILRQSLTDYLNDPVQDSDTLCGETTCDPDKLILN